MLHICPLDNPPCSCLIKSQYFSNHMLRISLLYSVNFGVFVFDKNQQHHYVLSAFVKICYNDFMKKKIISILSADAYRGQVIMIIQLKA